jgi:hypothetical protein
VSSPSLVVERSLPRTPSLITVMRPVVDIPCKSAVVRAPSDRPCSAGATASLMRLPDTRPQDVAVEQRILARIQSCIILILPGAWQGEAALEGFAMNSPERGPVPLGSLPELGPNPEPSLRITGSFKGGVAHCRAPGSTRPATSPRNQLTSRRGVLTRIAKPAVLPACAGTHWGR